MPMSHQAWFTRLAEQLPGWHVWYSSGPGSGWYAVPAPAEPDDRRPGWYLHLPNRIGPADTPQLLRAAARQRYGWDDTCATCGVLARDCGHRQPERDQRAEGPRR